jgi:hypothetical protein
MIRTLRRSSRRLRFPFKVDLLRRFKRHFQVFLNNWSPLVVRITSSAIE